MLVYCLIIQLHYMYPMPHTVLNWVRVNCARPPKNAYDGVSLTAAAQVDPNCGMDLGRALESHTHNCNEEFWKISAVMFLVLG